MKKFNRVSIIVLAIVFTVGLTRLITVFAATSPILGTASTFSVLAKTLISDVPFTYVAGDVGLDNAGTNYSGLTSAEVVGTIYDTNGTGPDGLAGNDPSLMTSARADNTAAYGALSTGSNATCTDPLYQFGTGNIDLATKVLPPGVYCADTFSLSGTLTLNDTGAPNGVWIFRSAATLITSGSGAADVEFLTGVGLSCNVWWKVVSSATLGTNTSFIGNILALTSISLESGTVLNGRAFAQNGVVTLDHNEITGPTCTGPATLNVIKHIVNNNGGTAVANAWTLGVTSSNGGSGTGSALGTETGTIYTLQPGKQYSVSESGGPSGYNASSSSECTIASAVASTAYTCTITNDDEIPILTLDKIVLNNSGGTALESAWTLTATGPTPISGPGATGSTDVVSGSTFFAGTYTLSESAGPSGYTASSWSCVTNGGAPVTGTSVTIDGDDNVVCTITNDDVTHSNSSSGSSRPPIIVPVPIIGILKVPSPLALPRGPGSATYDYTVWNVGGVRALTEVTVTDDKCGPVILLSGDLNNDLKLGLIERWKYSCTTTLSSTTTNTAIATGYSDDPYHQPATATATTTVVVGTPIAPLVLASGLSNVVSVPGLPNTGFPPEEKSTPWSVIILSGIFAVSVFLHFAQKKQTT